jgi:predicted transcriptional regulator
MKELFQSSETLEGAANISYKLASKLTDVLALRGAIQKAEDAAATRKKRDMRVKVK